MMKISSEVKKLQVVYVWVTILCLGCVSGDKMWARQRTSETETFTKRSPTVGDSVVSFLIGALKAGNKTGGTQSMTTQDESLRISVVVRLKEFIEIIKTEFDKFKDNYHKHKKRCRKNDKRWRRRYGNKRRRRNKNRFRKTHHHHGRESSSAGTLFPLKSDSPSMIVTTTSHLQKGWCQTKPMVQQIQEEGCISAEISNNFCYGQCNSFFIPKPGNDLTDDNSAAFRSCPFCKPRKVHWITVVLQCPTLTPPIRIKQVMHVEKCRCTSQISQ
ncbi:uncharacterized protein LOC111086330 [Limulus polyphemus]|uniref:Uncharacterized protein LOC111086330 n=1 Tax=Limulus polyphemus TaxID=6850 RepID=A0ABM1SLH0_LIMPO|nr:uncharacterized protein LOC111086330 [Limulus polyphemus]XP_022244475.1 uncharacterized protein LOC111086330 [Limulus polyphemus]XP_022244476.1 uncharacterized protein LOC111086330 [Limulus polyphemus]XP_022244477.1 uncharacterized protein LOC111086330 [Limulus polyphemus]